MAIVATAVFAGALLGIALISRIPIWALGAWKARSVARLFLAHLITFGLAATAYALLAANGGAPDWQDAFASYALPSLIVFTLDAIAIAAVRPAASADSSVPLWFVHAGGHQSGPLTTEALEAALAGSSVKPSDWIWRNGLKEWVQIESVDLIKPIEAPPLPAASKAMEEPGPPHRHWRDWFAPPVSYWISGFVIAAIFAGSSPILLNLELIHHPRLISIGLIVLWLALPASLLWLSIGVLRSVGRYAKAYPNFYRSGAAKVVTALAGLAVVAVFAQHGIPQIRNSATVIAETIAPRYQLRLLRDNTELELVGPMDLGLSDAIAASLTDHPAIVTLHVNSPGGRPSEADRLTEIILAKNLNTYVSTFCLGDCAPVFAAGKNRWLSRSAVLALHQPGGKVSELAARTARIKAYLKSRGIAGKVIDRGLASPREAAWRPTHAELFNVGFATAYATDAEVAVAGIPIREIDEAQRDLERIGLYTVLSEKHPAAHEAIVAILRNGYVKGQPVAAMRRRIWAIILPIVNKSLPSASDAALLSYYGVAVDEAQVFAEKDAASCEAFWRGRSEGFDFDRLPPELQDRELAATAELIRTSGSYVGKPIEKQEAGAVLAQLLPAAQSKGFSAGDLEKAIQFKLDAARNCQGLILFYRSLLQLADPGRTALLRFMAQQSGT